MNLDSTLQFDSDLSAVITRNDGTTEDHGLLDSGVIPASVALKKISNSKPFWTRMYTNLKSYFPLVLSGSALAYSYYHGLLDGSAMALVTTAGINLLAADFVSGASTHISAFNYIDAGTGTTAAAIGDTALQTPWGGARVSGTQSTPSAGQYRTTGTISFTGTFAVTEMGVFSASTVGTLWDHRVFSAINVNSGDSIQFTYTVTTTAGGS